MADYALTPLARVLFGILDQRAQDNEPCPTCGGDRLRTDFTDSGRCHAPRSTPTEETRP